MISSISTRIGGSSIESSGTCSMLLHSFGQLAETKRRTSSRLHGSFTTSQCLSRHGASQYFTIASLPRETNESTDSKYADESAFHAPDFASEPNEVEPDLEGDLIISSSKANVSVLI